MSRQWCGWMCERNVSVLNRKSAVSPPKQSRRLLAFVTRFGVNIELHCIRQKLFKASQCFLKSCFHTVCENRDFLSKRSSTKLLERISRDSFVIVWKKSPITQCLTCECVVNHNCAAAGTGMRSQFYKPACIWVLSCKNVCMGHTPLFQYFGLQSAVTIKSFIRNSLLYDVTPHSWHSVTSRHSTFLSSLSIGFSSPLNNCLYRFSSCVSHP